MSEAHICYLDLETSGLFPWKHGIVQIGYILESIPEGQYKGEVLVERDLKLNLFPSDEFDDRAGEVNGTTKNLVYNNPDRLEPRDALDQFKTDLKEYFGGGPCHLCGYNALKFDEEFLRKFWLKTRGGAFYKTFYTPTIDVLVLIGHLIRFDRVMLAKNYPKGTMKLGTIEQALSGELAEEGYVRKGSLHDALTDIRLTRYLYLVASKYTKWA
jgi:oligoribonuclease (3'-5' exoribonuclease)